MYDFINFRKITELSQEQLAGLLDVPKSTIYYAEKEGRTLHTAALLRMAKLESGLNDPDYVIRPVGTWMQKEKEHLETFLEKLGQKKRRLECSLVKKRHRLEKMGKAFKKCLTALKITSIMDDEYKSDRASAKDQEWHKLHMASTLLSYRDNGPLKIISLQAEIDRIVAELEITDKHILYLSGAMQGDKTGSQDPIDAGTDKEQIYIAIPDLVRMITNAST